MDYRLRLTARDGTERHQMELEFEEHDKGEVVSAFASPLLTLMLDVLDEGAAGRWDDEPTGSGTRIETRDTVEKLRPLLEQLGGSWLRYFKPPVEVVPLADLYEFAAALDDIIDQWEEWHEDQAALIVLLASAQIGKDIDDLAAYTELPADQVRVYAERLWAAGVWRAGRAYWPNLGKTLILTKDAMVADGVIGRVPGTDSWTLTEAYQHSEAPAETVLMEGV
jgi:hypothetical protein